MIIYEHFKLLILTIFKLYCNLLKLEWRVKILHHVFHDLGFFLLSFLSFHCDPSFIISIEGHDLLLFLTGTPFWYWAARLWPFQKIFSTFVKICPMWAMFGAIIWILLNCQKLLLWFVFYVITGWNYEAERDLGPFTIRFVLLTVSLET
jgi:hypothetical protein